MNSCEHLYKEMAQKIFRLITNLTTETRPIGITSSGKHSAVYATEGDKELFHKTRFLGLAILVFSAAHQTTV